MDREDVLTPFGLSPVPDLPALPAGSMSTPRGKVSRPDWWWRWRHYRNIEEKKSLYARKAKAIYEAQMRVHILRSKQAGADWATIAAELGVPIATVRRFYQQVLDRMASMSPPEQRVVLNTGKYVDLLGGMRRALGPGYSPGQHSRPRQLPPPRSRSSEENSGESGRHRRGRPRSGPLPPPPSGDPSTASEGAVEGEVFPSPEEQILREKCLLLIKAQQPYSVIAHALGITEKEARYYVREELRKLEDAELDAVDIERRLMVEQLNEMIAAVHPGATGQRFEQGEIVRYPPVLEAVDRMLKLFKQKADLLGLNAVPTVDIRMKLRLLAEESNYDYEELEDIAREVLDKHRIKLSGR